MTTTEVITDRGAHCRFCGMNALDCQDIFKSDLKAQNHCCFLCRREGARAAHVVTKENAEVYLLKRLASLTEAQAKLMRERAHRVGTREAWITVDLTESAMRCLKDAVLHYEADEASNIKPDEEKQG